MFEDPLTQIMVLAILSSNIKSRLSKQNCNLFLSMLSEYLKTNRIKINGKVTKSI